MRRRFVLISLCLALLAAPIYVDSFHIVLLTSGLVWAMLGLSVWLLLRILKMPSFGHAAFFGVAAYSAGLSVTQWGIDNIFLALALSIGITCLVALPIAIIASRLGSISFLLITLAFAEMLRSLALRWNQVGGSDGLVGVTRPGTWPLNVDLSEPVQYFYFTLLLLAVSALVLVILTRSSLGGVLVGIREGEGRMKALGYRVASYKVFAFLVSAAIAGAAGVAHAFLTRFVSPEELSALVSARGLLIVVIAGAAVWAPMLVAIILTITEDELSSWTSHWLGIIGIVYIVVALIDMDLIRRTFSSLFPKKLAHSSLAPNLQEEE